MNKSITTLQRLLSESIPLGTVQVDPPDQPEGTWWIDVRAGKKHQALEFRPGKGFGIHQSNAGFGEGPTEIYRTPERAAKRLVQLLATNGRRNSLHFKDIRELYGQSQIGLANKVGIKQSAISRFENRDEFKLSTLAAAIKALGGELEVRARFSDADVPISLSPKS